MSTTNILRNLLHQSPVLLVCLLGGFLAIFLMGRSKGAGLLAMFGCGAMFLARVGGFVANEYISGMREKDGLTNDQLSTYFMISNIAFSVGFASGLLMLLIAAMIGRKPKMDLRDELRRSGN